MKINKTTLAHIMHKKGFKNFTALATALGITKGQLSVILSNKYNPIKSNVTRLCALLNVPLTEIISLNNKSIEKAYSPTRKLNENNSTFVKVNNIKPQKQYNVLELFAGAGGLGLGLEKAGFKTIGLVEVDKYCCATLRQNRPNWNVIENDITNISKNITDYIPNNQEVDLISGGYPCQAFSYSGKKLGLADVRGTMFFYYADILQRIKPKLFLVENVKGLVNHDHGKTLQTMIHVFENIGYKITYKVLSALHYGVAQKRERLVLVGIRNDFSDIIYKFPKPLDKILTLKDILKDVPPSLGAQYSDYKKKVLSLVPPGGYWRNLPLEIAKSYMGKSYYSSGGRTGMARRLSWNEPSLTLTCSPAQKQTERCHPDETRPFTVREYARIQSFPDNWCFAGSMNQQYKQIGNAVPVNFAKMIGLSLISTLNKITLIETKLKNNDYYEYPLPIFE